MRTQQKQKIIVWKVAEGLEGEAHSLVQDTKASAVCE